MVTVGYHEMCRHLIYDSGVVGMGSSGALCKIHIRHIASLRYTFGSGASKIAERSGFFRHISPCMALGKCRGLGH